MEDTEKTTQFSASEALSKAWPLFKKDWAILLGVLAITTVISFVFSYVLDSYEQEPQTQTLFFTVLLINILNWIVSTLLTISWTNVYLRSSRSQETSLSDMFTRWGRFLPYLGATILSGLIILGGFLLLIVPGIIWSIKYMFVPYLIIDKNIGVKESLAASEKMTEGIKWRLLSFGVVLGLVNIAGLLALVVGLFVTVPLTTLASFVLYNQLLKRLEENSSLAPELVETSAK